MYSAPVELKVIKAKHPKGFVWNVRIARYSKVYPVTAYLYMDTGREYDGFTASLVQEFCGGTPFTLHFCGTRDSHERWCGIHAAASPEPWKKQKNTSPTTLSYLE